VLQAFQRVIIPCVQNCTNSLKNRVERQSCLDGYCYPKAMAADIEV